MTKQQFNEINLRNQIEQVKGLWFYENYKHGLKINKHQVKFDDAFLFELEYHKGDEECPGFICCKYYINDDYDHTLGYYDYDRYSDDPNELLQDICVYIANHI